jgi:hypothetical protein
MENVGFPIAEIAADGSCIVSKAAGTGGLVDCRTVKEQLLYEVHDPAAYITPDVVADITAATVAQVGPDQVRLAGVKGHPRTPTLKVLAYFDGGWLGEAEISYAGPNAEARARLAMDMMKKRLGAELPLRCDLIGVSSILGDDTGAMLAEAPRGSALDVRLRVAGKHEAAEPIAVPAAAAACARQSASASRAAPAWCRVSSPPPAGRSCEEPPCRTSRSMNWPMAALATRATASTSA